MKNYACSELTKSILITELCKKSKFEKFIEKELGNMTKSKKIAGVLTAIAFVVAIAALHY